MNRIKMPSMKEFAAAESALKNAGWGYRLTMMADDAKKDGVVNFGKFFKKGDAEFWLNFKTIGNLPA